MNIELLLLKKHTYTLIQQTKTKPEETLESKLNYKVETFSFIPPMNLSEVRKWLLALTSFEATNSVFSIKYENERFSILPPSYWTPNGGE